MCRLFGFRSIIPSQVHRSLMAADNALGPLSKAHPDGWGVAHYVDGCPHVTRSASTALHDALFHRLSGVVSSETVLAHVRKATVGAKTVLNCHPFQYGKWTFAHNGDIPHFDAKRAGLLNEIAPRLRRYVLGDTDSEVVFFVFLTALAQNGPLAHHHSAEDVIKALRNAVRRVRQLCDHPNEDTSLLTIIVTDGKTMAATHGGKELHMSTYKTRCSDRDQCPHLADECEAPSASGHVNHLVFSSTVMAGENVWRELRHGDIVGVDWRMRLIHAHVDHPRLTVLRHAADANRAGSDRAAGAEDAPQPQ
ncbi:MAG TPA: class II glutamine amidotransferase [Sorangium sp.]|nr:class II glutamine amidotransferase [Sorangium sp.]